MKLLFAFMFLAFTTVNLSADESPRNILYSTYNEYSLKVNKAKTVLPLLRYYSDEIYNSFDIYFKHSNLKEGINTLFSRLKFTTHLTQVSEHHEIKNNKTGCLVVSGTSAEKKRISIYVGFVKTSSWLINDINIEYLEDNEEYLKAPICDAEELMKKRTKNW